MKTTILTLFTVVLLFTSCTNNKVEKVKPATVEELGQNES